MSRHIDSSMSRDIRTIGIWRGLPAHRTTIEPSTRQFGLPA